MLMSPDKPADVALPLQIALPKLQLRGRKWQIVLVLLVVGGAAAWVPGMPFVELLAREPAPAPALAAPVPPVIIGLARLMPEGDLIRIAPPHGAGDARILALHFAVGDRVEAGALLATWTTNPHWKPPILPPGR